MRMLIPMMRGEEGCQWQGGGVGKALAGELESWSCSKYEEAVRHGAGRALQQAHALGGYDSGFESCSEYDLVHRSQHSHSCNMPVAHVRSNDCRDASCVWCMGGAFSC